MTIDKDDCAFSVVYSLLKIKSKAHIFEKIFTIFKWQNKSRRQKSADMIQWFCFSHRQSRLHLPNADCFKLLYWSEPVFRNAGWTINIQYTRISFSLIFLKILWSFQKNKKDHHGVFFIFADKLTYYTSAHLVSSFLLFLLTLWSRTCNLSCCFYWWNFWILRHEEIFI